MCWALLPNLRANLIAVLVYSLWNYFPLLSARRAYLIVDTHFREDDDSQSDDDHINPSSALQTSFA